MTEILNPHAISPLETQYSEEALLERERVTKFQETLSRVTVRPLTVVVDTQEREPDVAAAEEFFRTDLRLGTNLYAIPELASLLTDELTGFEPFVSRGGKASGHGVFFGALTLADGSELNVAVKPHTANDDDVISRRAAERSCLKDYFTNVSAKQCGFESLKPVGFIFDDEGSPYSLTVLDEGIKSLESIDWTRFYQPGYTSEGMRELLYKSAIVAADLHATGNSAHGDFEPRNLVSNPYGHVFLIDWEYGTITDAPSRDVDERFGNSWKDLRRFMISLVKPNRGKYPGVDLFRHCDGDYWQEFKDIFFDDYVEFRHELAEQGSHHMNRLRDTEAELAQLESSLKEEMALLEKTFKGDQPQA